MNEESRVGSVRWIRLAIAAGCSVAVVWLAWPFLSMELIGRSLAGVTIGPLIAGGGAYLGVTALRARRFTLAGAEFSFGTAFAVAAIHSALLRVMPLRSGELAYAILHKRLGRGGLGKGIAVLAMLRLLDLIVILPLTAALLSLLFTGAPTARIVVALVLGSLLLMGVYFALGLVSRRLGHRWVGPEENPSAGRIRSFLRTLVQTFSIPLKTRLLLLGTTTVMWALVLLWFHLVLSAVQADLTLVRGFAIGIMGVVGSMLPLSLIGSIGPMEGGFAVGLAASGLDPELATARSLVASSCTLAHNWLVALVAGGWLLVTKRTKRY